MDAGEDAFLDLHPLQTILQADQASDKGGAHQRDLVRPAGGAVAIQVDGEAQQQNQHANWQQGIE